MNPSDPTPTPSEDPVTDFGVADVRPPAPDAGTEDLESEPDHLPDEASSELAGWKSRLRYDFERWLSTVDEIPWLRAAEREAAEPPDLYAFFEQLAVLNTESRRANRRTAEALSQWGESLLRLQGDLDRVRDLATQSLASRGPAERLSRTHCLALVEVLDRLQRLATAFAQTPSRPWFGGDGAWRRAWENQRQAFLIVTDHLEALVRKEGVVRIETSGKPFDPHQMTAVAAEPTRQQPPQTVLEETARGYLWNGELLRPAQVKIAIPAPNP